MSELVTSAALVLCYLFVGGITYSLDRRFDPDQSSEHLVITWGILLPAFLAVLVFMIPIWSGIWLASKRGKSE